MDLTTAIASLNAKCNALDGTVATMLQQMREIGEEATTVKIYVGHGKFESFVAKNVPFGIRKLQRCMSVYRHWDELQHDAALRETFSRRLFGNVLKKQPPKNDVTSFLPPSVPDNPIQQTDGEPLADAVESTVESETDQATAQALMEEEVRKVMKPWEARLDTDGQVSVLETLSSNLKRRIRISSFTYDSQGRPRAAQGRQGAFAARFVLQPVMQEFLSKAIWLGADGKTQRINRAASVSRKKAVMRIGSGSSRRPPVHHSLRQGGSKITTIKSHSR